MSRPVAIDGLQFARDRGECSGRLDLARLPRLAESNGSTDGIDFALRGGENSQGKPSISISASGRLGLVCQRCLGPLTFDLAVDVELELSADAAFIASAEDDVDRVLASPAMDVATLVEDEVLLALPAAAKHEHCMLRAEDGGVAKESPFSVLRALNASRKNG